MHDTRGWGSDMHDDDTHGSVSRVYKTALHHHILTFFSSPPQHTKYIFNCSYFIPIGLGARKMSTGTGKKRERAMYVWCDQLLRAASAHLNTPLSHWTNEADGSTVACLEDYTIITGFTNISSPHAAPSLSHHLSHTTQFPGLLWHVKCTPPPCLIHPFQAMQYRILFN